MNEMNDDPSLEELASSLALPKDATLPTTTMAAFTADEFDPQPVTSVVDAQRVYRQTVTRLQSDGAEAGAGSQAATLASMPMGFCWAMADFRGTLAGVPDGYFTFGTLPDDGDDTDPCSRPFPRPLMRCRRLRQGPSERRDAARVFQNRSRSSNSSLLYREKRTAL